MNFFQLNHGENKLNSMRFKALAHLSNSLQVDMSLHSYPLFWFLANQSLLLLLTAGFLVEKQQIPIL